MQVAEFIRAVSPISRAFMRSFTRRSAVVPVSQRRDSVHHALRYDVQDFADLEPYTPVKPLPVLAE